MNKISWVVLGVCVIMSGWLVGPMAQEVMAQEMEAVSQQEQQELLEQAVMPFLKALQTGDASRLEQLIGGKLALTLGKLLRANTAYPDFLRQRYGGTTVQEPIQIAQHHQATSPTLAQEQPPCLAVVHLLAPDGRPDHFELHLEQDAQGAWKVIDKTMVR